MSDKDFENLLVKNQQALYEYCRRLTRHKERAEDLQQETNARMWTKRHLYEDEGKFLSWAKLVAKNHYLNQVKKEALIPIKTMPDFGDVNEDSLEDFMAWKRARSEMYSLHEAPNQEDYWLENRINEVIATLPAPTALLIQKKLQGMTYAQIAKPLGIKPNNAKQRYFNDVKVLRQKLLDSGLLDN